MQNYQQADSAIKEMKKNKTPMNEKLVWILSKNSVFNFKKYHKHEENKITKIRLTKQELPQKYKKQGSKNVNQWTEPKNFNINLKTCKKN